MSPAIPMFFAINPPSPLPAFHCPSSSRLTKEKSPLKNTNPFSSDFLAKSPLNSGLVSVICPFDVSANSLARFKPYPVK